MRIRTVKPDFWRSDDITRLSREDRLLYVGLWSYVDDNGVGIDDYRQIAAELFALEEDQNEVRTFIREGLATLSRGLLIIRYEVAGRRYIYIPTFHRHQRVDKPNKPRYPQPDAATCENARSRDTLATPSRHPRETPAPGEREKGRKGEENNTPSLRSAIARFGEFYAAYPRHVGRRDAEKAWTAAMKRGVDPEHAIIAAGRYADECRGREARYIAHPSTWLNQGRYDDEPAPSPRPEPSRAQQWLALADQRPDVIDAEVIDRRALP